MTVRKRATRRREDFDAMAERPSEQENPEEVAIERDLIAAVREILVELPEHQAEAILSRAIEVAPRNVPAATLRKRLQRGLRALREAWRTRHAAG